MVHPRDVKEQTREVAGVRIASPTPIPRFLLRSSRCCLAENVEQTTIKLRTKSFNVPFYKRKTLLD